MRLFDRYLAFLDRLWERTPWLIQGILIPWVLIGILIAVVPDLQQMPSGIRMVIGFPAGMGMLMMATGMFLMIADKLLGVASFVRRKLKGAR